MTEKILGFEPNKKKKVVDDDTLKLIRDQQKRKPPVNDDGTPFFKPEAQKEVQVNIKKKGKVWPTKKK